MAPGQEGKKAYGQWYIPVDKWKVRPMDQMLVGPQMEAKLEAEEQAARKQREDIANRLEKSAGAKLFRDYLVKNGSSTPSFLDV